MTHGEPPVSSDEVPPAFEVHDVRHTHATHLLQADWPITTVSRRLGHAIPGITMSSYAHAPTDTHGENIRTPTAFVFVGPA